MVLSVDELPPDPQFQARGFFTEIAHPVAGPLLQAGAPFQVKGARRPAGRAPLLGEHNEEVYRGMLGYTAQELSQLRGMGVI
jgi:crotonobetainyl-CoA:carnitine CoA-transferase CaiB-like acyl-CoA transferase